MIRKTKYCDRCGAEMPFDHFPRAERKLTGTLRIGHGQYDYYSESYDMCKKCCKAFEQFMKGGEGDG